MWSVMAKIVSQQSADNSQLIRIMGIMYEESGGKTWVMRDP